MFAFARMEDTRGKSNGIFEDAIGFFPFGCWEIFLISGEHAEYSGVAKIKLSC